MLNLFIVTNIISNVMAILIGLVVIGIIRVLTKKNAAENRPAGFWVRSTCFGVDLALIGLAVPLVAYGKSIGTYGVVTVILTLSYFFFFWLFFSATPICMLARIRVVSDTASLSLRQVLIRFGVSFVLVIGWIPMLFDKNKRALHDIAAGTKVVYASAAPSLRLFNILNVVALGLVVLLLVSVVVHGSGEKLTDYTEGARTTFFDLDGDNIQDGVSIDADGDGEKDTFKYDANNDTVIDFSTYDTDADGIAESVDVNNDGRIDGFDFNNDNILDAKVSRGQFVIWLWRTWFIALLLGLLGILAYAFVREKNKIS